MKAQPYTYLIGWTEIETPMFYYGVRFKQGCHTGEFWEYDQYGNEAGYFTSSPGVRKFRKQHGDPDLIYTYQHVSKSQATSDERDVLQNFIKNGDTAIWINKNYAGIDLTYTPIKVRARNRKAKSQKQKKIAGNWRHAKEKIVPCFDVSEARRRIKEQQGK